LQENDTGIRLCNQLTYPKISPAFADQFLKERQKSPTAENPNRWTNEDTTQNYKTKKV
jgi:hypothetical protein